MPFERLPGPARDYFFTVTVGIFEKEFQTSKGGKNNVKRRTFNYGGDNVLSRDDDGDRPVLLAF